MDTNNVAFKFSPFLLLMNYYLIKTSLCLFLLFFFPITLVYHWSIKDDITTISFHLILFSATLAELAKSIPVHSLILSSSSSCYLFFFFLFIVLKMIFAYKLENLQTWPNHLSVCFMTTVRCFEYSWLLGSFCEPPHW